MSLWHYWSTPPFLSVCRSSVSGDESIARRSLWLEEMRPLHQLLCGFAPFKWCRHYSVGFIGQQLLVSTVGSPGTVLVFRSAAGHLSNYGRGPTRVVPSNHIATGARKWKAVRIEQQNTDFSSLGSCGFGRGDTGADHLLGVHMVLPTLVWCSIFMARVPLHLPARNLLLASFRSHKKKPRSTARTNPALAHDDFE